MSRSSRRRSLIVVFGHAVDGGDLAIAEPGALQRAEQVGGHLAQLPACRQCGAARKSG